MPPSVLAAPLVGELFGLLLIFARIGMAIAVLPVFSTTHVPIRVRLLMALAITVLVAPVIGERLPAMPSTPALLVLMLLGETVIGLFIGSIPRLMFAALQVAGTFIAFLGGFASALIQDPIAEQQSSTIAGFFATLGVVLVFAADLHHPLLHAVVDSYRLFEPASLPPLADFAQVITRTAIDGFALGAQLAAPFVIISLVYTVGLGLIGRLMPQLQVFFVALPLQVGLNLWVMVLTISSIMLVFLNRFAESFGSGIAG